MDLGIELGLVCNLTLKYLKDLKYQRGSKGSEYVLFDEEGNPDIFDDWPFVQEPRQVLHSRVFWVD